MEMHYHRNYRLKFKVLSIVILVIFFSCRKLPSSTQAGLNKIGFYFGNELVVNNQINIMTYGFITGVDSNLQQFYIYNNSDKYIFSLCAKRTGLNSFTLVPENDNILNNPYNFKTSIEAKNTSDLKTKYFLCVDSSININVTKLDTNNRILSGNFEFYVKNNNSEVKKISKGVFDCSIERIL